MTVIPAPARGNLEEAAIARLRARFGITRRRAEILLIGAMLGLTNDKDLARLFRCAPHTVTTHWWAIRRAMGLVGRKRSVVLARAHVVIFPTTEEGVH